MAGVRDEREVLQKAFALVFRQGTEHFTLQIKRQGARDLISLLALWKQPDPMRASIRLMSGSFHKFICLHSLQQRRNRIGVARDSFRYFSL